VRLVPRGPVRWRSPPPAASGAALWPPARAAPQARCRRRLAAPLRAEGRPCAPLCRPASVRTHCLPIQGAGAARSAWEAGCAPSTCSPTGIARKPTRNAAACAISPEDGGPRGRASDDGARALEPEPAVETGGEDDQFFGCDGRRAPTTELAREVRARQRVSRDRRRQAHHEVLGDALRRGGGPAAGMRGSLGISMRALDRLPGTAPRGATRPLRGVAFRLSSSALAACTNPPPRPMRPTTKNRRRASLGTSRIKALAPGRKPGAGGRLAGFGP